MAKQDVSKVRISRDGLVRFWDVFARQWATMGAVELATSPKYSPTLSQSERDRVCQFVVRRDDRHRRTMTPGAHCYGHFG